MQEEMATIDLFEKLRRSEYDHRSLQLVTSLELRDALTAEEITRLETSSAWYLEHREELASSYSYLGYKL